VALLIALLALSPYNTRADGIVAVLNAALTTASALLGFLEEDWATSGALTAVQLLMGFVSVVVLFVTKIVDGSFAASLLYMLGLLLRGFAAVRTAAASLQQRRRIRSAMLEPGAAARRFRHETVELAVLASIKETQELHEEVYRQLLANGGSIDEQLQLLVLEQLVKAICDQRRQRLL
jgi:hypothetical protein